MHPLKKAFFVALGCISLALGTIGIALPILPTVPFYLLTAFCFANSSERLHTWFTHTTVYKKYIGSYFRRRPGLSCPFLIWSSFMRMKVASLSVFE